MGHSRRIPKGKSVSTGPVSAGRRGRFGPGAAVLINARKAAAAGDFLTAEVLCDEAIKRAPRDVAALEFRARLLAQRGLFLKAAEQLKPLAAQFPGNRDLRRLHAHWVRRAGLHQQAVGLYDSLVRSDANDVESVEGMATSLVMLGERDRARGLLEEAFRQGHATPAMSVTLVRVLIDSGENEQAVIAAQQHLARADLRDGHRRRLHALLGKGLEREGRFDEAFAAYARAAEYERIPFDRRAYRVEIDSLIAFFSRDWFRKCPRSAVNDDAMVFIVGMPRSGSTLTERILDAHPLARAVGEHPAMFGIMDRIRTDLNFLDPWPERVQGLSPVALSKLAADYLAEVRPQDLDGATRPLRLIDKALWNTHALGLIAMLLPHSRVIWARRHPEDSCFSCFAESFDPPLAPYGSELGNLGFVHRELDRLMRHWQEVLPVPLRLVQYEELVANQQSASEAIVEFAGLPWHPDCLEFYRKASPSATRSHEQVRRPVYDSSVGRASRFEAHLGPLREALAGR